MMKDQYCVVLWNDDQDSYEETIQILCDVTNRTREDASALVRRLDENGREVIDLNANIIRLLEIGASACADRPQGADLPSL